MNIRPTKTPDRITPAILKGCNQLVPDSSPVFIERKPAIGAIINKCVYNVKNHLLNAPGEMVLGWEVTVWDGVLLDCIGHAVLRHEDKLTCITPSNYGDQRLLFLPDSSLTFDFNDKMARMSSTQVAISQIPEVKRLIEIESRERSIKTKYPVSSAPMAVMGLDAHELQQIAKEKQSLFLKVILATSDNSTKCPCGSGKKFRKCHKAVTEHMLGRL